MIFTQRSIDYLDRVHRAVDTGALGRDRLTNHCPECDEDLTWLDASGDEHVAVTIPGTEDANGVRDVAVVIACEGYWVIDPAAVGLDRGQWQSWDTLPDNATGDDFRD